MQRLVLPLAALALCGLTACSGADLFADAGELADAEADSGAMFADATVDLGVVTDTGPGDTGIVADTGVDPDTGVVPDTGPQDTGSDAGPQDMGPEDTGGAPDTGANPDTGVVADTGVVFDMGAPDQGTPPVDAGRPDLGGPLDVGGGPQDAMLPDTGADAGADTGVVDSGPGDSGPSDQGMPPLDAGGTICMELNSCCPVIPVFRFQQLCMALVSSGVEADCQMGLDAWRMAGYCP